jgi:hypothetical protein
LTVAAAPSTARIYIDANPAGVGRAERFVAPGEHRIEARAPGYETFARTLRTGTSGEVRVDATLARPGRPLPAGAVIAIASGAVAVVLAGVLVATLASAPAPAYPAAWGNVEALQAR